MFPKNNKKILVRGFIIHVSSNFHSLYILPAFGLNNEREPGMAILSQGCGCNFHSLILTLIF